MANSSFNNYRQLFKHVRDDFIAEFFPIDDSQFFDQPNAFGNETRSNRGFVRKNDYDSCPFWNAKGGISENERKRRYDFIANDSINFHNMDIGLFADQEDNVYLIVGSETTEVANNIHALLRLLIWDRRYPIFYGVDSCSCYAAVIDYKQYPITDESGEDINVDNIEVLECEDLLRDYTRFKCSSTNLLARYKSPNYKAYKLTSSVQVCESKVLLNEAIGLNVSGDNPADIGLSFKQTQPANFPGSITLMNAFKFDQWKCASTSWESRVNISTTGNGCEYSECLISENSMPNPCTDGQSSGTVPARYPTAVLCAFRGDFKITIPVQWSPDITWLNSVYILGSTVSPSILADWSLEVMNNINSYTTGNCHYTDIRDSVTEESDGCICHSVTTYEGHPDASQTTIVNHVLNFAIKDSTNTEPCDCEGSMSSCLISTGEFLNNVYAYFPNTLLEYQPYYDDISQSLNSLPTISQNPSSCYASDASLSIEEDGSAISSYTDCTYSSQSCEYNIIYTKANKSYFLPKSLFMYFLGSYSPSSSSEEEKICVKEIIYRIRNAFNNLINSYKALDLSFIPDDLSIPQSYINPMRSSGRLLKKLTYCWDSATTSDTGIDLYYTDEVWNHCTTDTVSNTEIKSDGIYDLVRKQESYYLPFPGYPWADCCIYKGDHILETILFGWENCEEERLPPPAY